MKSKPAACSRIIKNRNDVDEKKLRTMDVIACAQREAREQSVRSTE